MSELEAIKGLCRVCLHGLTNSTPINIFDISFANNQVYQEMLEECTSYKLNDAENLPIFICTLCANLITQYYDFKIKFLENQLKLQNLTNRPVKTEIGEIFIKEEENVESDFGIPDYKIPDHISDSEVSTDPDESFKCDKCDESFSFKLIEYKEHLQLVHNDKPFVCDHCNKTFGTESALKAHSIRHEFHCKICFIQLKDNEEVKLHSKTHVLKENSVVVCKYCDKQFESKARLTIHWRQHTGERPYLCPICGKLFAVSGNLSKHLRTHNGTKSYKCKECDAAFTHWNTFESHTATHSIDRRHKCEKCQKLFLTESYLRRHFETHNLERNFLCTHCGKKFRTKKVLGIHSKIHTSLRTYRCDICFKAFNRASNLTTHKRIHTGERPFNCTFCDRKFGFKHVLNAHLKTHKSVKTEDVKFKTEELNTE